MGELPDLAVTVPALLIAGVFAGFAAGLFGIGGGFVVVPALFFILPLLGVEQAQVAHVAIGTSLATIIFTSLRSTYSHAARGAVDFAFLRAWAPWVALGTVAGAVIAGRISGEQLASVFGVGLLGFAIYFLLPQRKLEASASQDAQMPRGPLRAGMASTLGAMSALLGIGGGTPTTLVMTLYGAPIHRAIGTAAGMGAIIAIPSTIGFVIIGAGETGLGWGTLGFVNIPAAVVVTAASVLMAPLGVATAHWLSPGVLRRVFAIYLLVVGLYMIVD